MCRKELLFNMLRLELSSSDDTNVKISDSSFQARSGDPTRKSADFNGLRRTTARGMCKIFRHPFGFDPRMVGPVKAARNGGTQGITRRVRSSGDEAYRRYTLQSCTYKRPFSVGEGSELIAKRDASAATGDRPRPAGRVAAKPDMEPVARAPLRYCAVHPRSQSGISTGTCLRVEETAAHIIVDTNNVQSTIRE
jgi:hypothetical protein